MDISCLDGLVFLRVESESLDELLGFKPKGTTGTTRNLWRLTRFATSPDISRLDSPCSRDSGCTQAAPKLHPAFALHVAMSSVAFVVPQAVAKVAKPEVSTVSKLQEISAAAVAAVSAFSMEKSSPFGLSDFLNLFESFWIFLNLFESIWIYLNPEFCIQSCDNRTEVELKWNQRDGFHGRKHARC